MSEMRMALEEFAAGDLDFAGLQRRIAEELAVGYSVDDALADLHAICEEDGMSQGLYNVLRRAITRVAEGDDTAPVPDGGSEPDGEPPDMADVFADEDTDSDLPAMFTHPEQLLPDELPPDPLRAHRKKTPPPEITLADEELLSAARAATAEDSLGADALITGDLETEREDIAVEESRRAGLPEAGDVIADRYVVQSIVGRGGMGVVYRVLDRCREACESDDTMVALKMLKPELHHSEGSDRRLMLEALQGQRLVHPNLVHVLDVGMDRGRAFVTMELLEGELLRSALTRRAPEAIGGDEGLQIITGIGRGLAYLHRHGYVHSDLKPRNVFLANDGEAKLLDFGLSRRPGRALEPVLDGGETPARTPAYASPAILRGEAPGFQDDVFALACVASELLTGSHPYGRLPADQAAERNLKPGRVRGLAGYQQRALGRALSLRASRRQADADAFLREMGLVEESQREQGPGFLQGALLGLGAGLLLTLAIISPEGPLQRLISVTTGDGPEPAPVAETPATQPATADTTPPAPRPGALEPSVESGPVITPGGTFSPAIETDDDAPRLDSARAAEGPADSAPETTDGLSQAPTDDTPVAPPSDPTLVESDTPPVSLPPPAAGEQTAAVAESPGRLAFETETYEVDEGSAVLIARVVRSEGTRGEVAFRWRTLGGSAAPDEDFVATDWQRTSMADGQTSARIFIPLVNDGVAEGPESFMIELARPEGGVELVEDPRVRVVIRDDDPR